MADKAAEIDATISGFGGLYFGMTSDAPKYSAGLLGVEVTEAEGRNIWLVAGRRIDEIERRILAIEASLNASEDKR